MKTPILLALNLFLAGLFIVILWKPGRLSYFRQGRWWLTWLSVAVITLMDELTSPLVSPHIPLLSQPFK
jgi:hypothetical protein